MLHNKQKILLTGVPGVGKSTLLKAILNACLCKKTGFITEEILDQNRKRIGFEVLTSKGNQTIIATVDNNPGQRLGKYRIMTEEFDELIHNIYTFGDDDLLYIDEIGPMQIYAKNFSELVQRYLDSENFVIATIKKNQVGKEGFEFIDDYISQIKNRPDVQLIEVTLENRSYLYDYFLKFLDLKNLKN